LNIYLLKKYFTIHLLIDSLYKLFFRSFKKWKDEKIGQDWTEEIGLTQRRTNCLPRHINIPDLAQLFHVFEEYVDTILVILSMAPLLVATFWLRSFMKKMHRSAQCGRFALIL